MSKEKGFTLVELLVVIAIIGILAAIAIPQFQEYRKRGYDAGARSDLRNAATAEEAYFIDNDQYADCTETNCHTVLPGFSGVSKTVSLTMTANNGDSPSFTGEASAAAGSEGTVYYWNSEEGGMVDALP
ncbi:MAG: prepilin-type N-terminal cleavage/methylation domain-containing protein [Deltaproteobacteria bacterium]|nr:prepilin-type N-terminal cleavage/methylation domain-containing protein [Deltaproteobacteria bacterium]